MITLRRKADLLLRGIGDDCGDVAPDDAWLDSIDDGAALRLFAGQALANVVGGRIRWTKVLETVPELALRTSYINDWESRGRPVMSGSGLAALWHWTAGRPSAKNPAPSLNICINGRSDVPGPLVQLFIDANGKLYVIASGRANHAGIGNKELIPRFLGGLPPAGSAAELKLANTGGSGGTLVGIELEHRGDSSPLTAEQLRTLGMLSVAFRKGLDMNEAQAIRWHHKAWTDRKVDIDGVKLAAMLNEHRRVSAGPPAKIPVTLPPIVAKVLWLLQDGRIVEVLNSGVAGGHGGAVRDVRWLPTIAAVKAKLADGYVQTPAPAGVAVNVVP